MLNGLRDRITVQCDGGMRTARDVIVAALLGAEEYGFATAPLVVSGCIMMRVCHLDTCPVGVATQNPELRARFNGKPEFVETFFRFIAEDIRRYLAELGFRSIDDAVGHAEVLDKDKGVAHWKSMGLDLTAVFAVPTNRTQRRRVRGQDHGLDQALDRTLIQLAEGALEDAHPVRLELPVRNVNRTVGTLLGSEVTRRYGGQGLPDDTIHVTLTGSAGQSIGAFLPPGITLELIGDANDYVGKGLSGGRVIVRPPDDVLFLPEDNVIAGNTLLFGATSGEVYLRGRVGERFAARNSGALTVVEGVGDHACEYMTGGRVVVLGKTGRNMAAGMSGGIAFVLGLDPAMVNPEMVELQRLEPEDLTWLRGVIAKHAAYTGSTVATSVLSDWPRRSAQFIKVMPTDYQRVLQATRMAKAEGRDVDTAIMEASRG
jgi:glutamate synthase domain-containing protein 3